MRYRTSILAFVALVMAILPFSSAPALPPCQGTDTRVWDECHAMQTFQESSKWAGDSYVGEWRNGERDGYGIYTHSNGAKHTGEWKDGQRNGQGVSKLSNGDKYVGQYRNDQRDGYGVYTTTDGSRYEGYWVQNMREGWGFQTFSNGQKYEGMWRQDKPNGKGTVYFGKENERSWAGLWIDGKRVIQQGSFYIKQTNQTPTKLSRPHRSGTGFFISETGHLITALHVVENCSEVKIHQHKKAWSASLLNKWPEHDLALLKTNFEPLIILTVANNDPTLLQKVHVSVHEYGGPLTVKAGSISRVEEDDPLIHLGIGLNEGASGGPIVDTETGRVVGMVRSKRPMGISDPTPPEQIGFGIKGSLLRQFLASSKIQVPHENTNTISMNELGTLLKNGTSMITCSINSPLRNTDAEKSDTPNDFYESESPVPPDDSF